MTMTRSSALILALGLLLATASTVSWAADTCEPTVLRVNGDGLCAAEIKLLVNVLDGHLPAAEASDQPIGPSEALRAIDHLLLAQEARQVGLEPKPRRVEIALRLADRKAGDRQTLVADLERAGTSLERLVHFIGQMEIIKEHFETNIGSQIDLTEEQIASFYTSHPELAETPERVEARHVFIPLQQGAEPDDEQAAATKAANALMRARAGGDFAALATELSDERTADRGGSLGVFSFEEVRLRAGEPFARAVFALEPGEISEVVRTGSGYHVIKVEERYPPSVRSLDEVRATIEHRAVLEETITAANALVEKLRASARIETSLPLPDEIAIQANPLSRSQEPAESDGHGADATGG